MTHKSEKVLALAREEGWEAEVEPKTENAEVSGDYNDIEWHLYAKRDEEAIHVVWYGDRLDNGLYTYGEFSRKLWWKVEVVRFLKGKPDPKKFATKARKTEEVPVRAVPWNGDEPAFEIMKATINKKIWWIRQLDGQVCEARVDVNLKDPASAKGFKVYESRSGRRMLEWVDTVGFHTVALDTIINVA